MNTGARVTICFDDGRETAVTEGSRILEKYKARGTFFPITSYVGTTNQHGVYADWAQIENLAQREHEIGNHTHTHQSGMAEWDASRQDADIKKATEELQAHRITPVTFAYPFGLYTKGLHEVVKAQGFKGARLTELGLNKRDTDPFCLKCVEVEKRMSAEDIGFWIEAIRRNQTWLILCFHHINNNTRISTPADIFEEMIADIYSRNIPIITLAKGLEK